jgi:succinate-acetate transporter protein
MAASIPAPGPAPGEPVRLVRSAPEPATRPLAGDPAMLALPSFIVASVVFGMALIGYVPTASIGPMLPIIIAASVGLFLATIWAAVIGETPSAGVYGIFTGFFLSEALLYLGTAHGWFGITPPTIAETEKLFVIAWMVVITMLVLATFRLPVVYPVVFGLVDVSLLLYLLSIIQSQVNLAKAAGWVVMAFSAVTVYLFLGSAYHATGGRVFPLGKPILHA